MTAAAQVMEVQSLKLSLGNTVNKISNDGNMAGNSSAELVTEQAIKTYVDSKFNQTPVIFKVRGEGFAVKDLPGSTTIETDIWNLEAYDTRNAFNTTTKRFVCPEAGYYYLHAVIRQSNNATDNFFRISFNVDSAARYSTIVDGDDVKTEVSGIYFLNLGQEVFVRLRNFSTGANRIDGLGSWFEGYKIR